MKRAPIIVLSSEAIKGITDSYLIRHETNSQPDGCYASAGEDPSW